jgi:hypothetical protein
VRHTDGKWITARRVGALGLLRIHVRPARNNFSNAPIRKKLRSERSIATLEGLTNIGLAATVSTRAERRDLHLLE